MCAPSFLVSAHLTTCVHAHSLEGTLAERLVTLATIICFNDDHVMQINGHGIARQLRANIVCNSADK